MAHPEVGHLVLQKALDYFSDKVAVERETKFEGRNLSVIISKTKGGIKHEEDENKKIAGEES